MGAGVNLFKTLFAEDYYPHTANILMSAKPTSKVIKDSNNQTIQTINLSGVEQRGLIKVGTNGLYADGDTDDGSGTGEVRYGIVDLGSLNWSYYGGVMFTTELTDIKPFKASSIANIITSDYEAIDNSMGIAQMPDMTCKGQIDDTRLYIKDSRYSDGATFKTAMSGHYLVYKLATPTTQTLTAWNNPITACEGGTEEFTDTRAIKLPTGHDTQYYTETEGDKLSALPEVTGEQGDFIINNADGKMTLKKRNVYSETEKVVGTWIDGKPIYQKTLTGTFEAENNILSIQAPNYTLAILSASGFLLHTNETDTITINGCFDVTQTYCVVFHSITDDGILIKRYSTSAGGSTPTAYVTIQYVKTT